MAEFGQWDVALAEDNSGVLLAFHHATGDGVEVFKTGMPREHALAFAACVLNHALEIDP